MSELQINNVLTDNYIVLCGGTGGVGKTTTAAALGIIGAGLGRKTLVLTIDPARRLAAALGLDSLGAHPQQIDEVPGLYAMMLDPGSTFDELIQRHASDRKTAEDLLSHPYYQQISAGVAGSREFMAMEKIHELAESHEYELLIVDTPPAQYALDFIDAPKRLIEILDGSGFSLLLRANHFANKLSFGFVNKSQQQFARLFEQLTGHTLMLDINSYFNAFSDVTDGFRTRAGTLQALLRSEKSTFLLVMTPASDTSLMARTYLQRLHKEGMHVSGAVFNQTHHVANIAPELDLAASAVNAGLSGSLFERASACHAQALVRSQRDNRIMETWQKDMQLATREIPRLEGNVSKLEDLQSFAWALSADLSSRPS